MDDGLLIPVLVIFVAGALAARLSGFMVRRWLLANTGWKETFGDRALRYFFGIFVDIGPVRQYAEARRVRSESTTLATVFWGGFAVTMLGIVGLIALLIEIAG